MISRLLEGFAKRYVETNETQTHYSQDDVLVLAYAIIMLNTDLHGVAHTKFMRKMSMSDFQRNLMRLFFMNISLSLWEINKLKLCAHTQV